MFTQGRVRVIVLGLADAICIGAVWALAVWGYWLLGKGLLQVGISTSIGGYMPADYLSFWPVVVTFVVVNAFFGLYHGSWMYPSAPLSSVDEFRYLVDAALLTHVGVIAFLAFRYQTTDGYSRVVIVASGLMTALLCQSFRNWARIWMAKNGVGLVPVLLAGGGEVAARVAEVLAENPHMGFKVAGYFEGTARKGRKARRREWSDRKLTEVGVKYLGSLREIVPVARKRDIKILLACQDSRLFRAQLQEFSGWFTYIDYIPSVRAFPIFGARPVSFDGIGGIEMVNQVRMKVKRAQKRVLDMVCTIVAFVLSAPLFIIIAVLVKLTSRGPIFYRHARLGRNGTSIKVWKFRSMYADADDRLAQLLSDDATAAEEWKANFKLAKDPRITPLGRFLRKTSLDELPQLFNVFAGDMSLIGPRPIVQDEVKYYSDSYKIFSSVRPGVTGLWQVSGRSDTDYNRRVALDTYYVLNWSPWMDIWILIRTVYAVLFMRGAR